ncbi:MAG: UvrB/UvrC motif-containing protein [Pirellulales bacterium]|jgi:protein arginine kinase activator
MKCQHCERPATFHITELTDEVPDELHLCEEHARVYLIQAEAPESESPSIAGALAQHLKIGQAAEELARLDQQACPICGITFYEFRHAGRLGCPHDYVCFEDKIEPIIMSIHNATQHVGKRPKSGKSGTDRRTELIRLRRDMEAAVGREDYEQASTLRDEIQNLSKSMEADDSSE